MDPDTGMLDASRRLSEALAPGDLDQTLDRITRAAVEVLPDVAYASITVKHGDGSLETSAPTDPLILDLDAAQYKLQEGPCYEAATDTMHVTAPHLADDDRFPDLEMLGQLFVHQSAVALAYARQVGQLNEAVQTRQLIGQAVGVTMERFDLDEARAFGFLTRLSQDNNIKLRVIAERLLDEVNERQRER
jgi:hypothetical protein